jgi:hypothetical protein
MVESTSGNRKGRTTTERRSKKTEQEEVAFVINYFCITINARRPSHYTLILPLLRYYDDDLLLDSRLAVTKIGCISYALTLWRMGRYFLSPPILRAHL